MEAVGIPVCALIAEWVPGPPTGALVYSMCPAPRCRSASDEDG